jgi:RimJ/RimL family protein N-acetyltransferase
MSAVAEANTPSIRIVERLGATDEGMTIIPPDRAMRIYRYPRPQAQKTGTAA